MTFSEIKSHFITYCKPFLDTDDTRIKTALQFKFKHSENVSTIANNISLFVFRDEINQENAKIAGLLHDIARFEQMKQFNTFIDAKSFNHGEKAVEIIKTENFLVNINSENQTTILEAIKVHNKMNFSPFSNEITQLTANILRDADKIDILNSIAEIYSSPDSTSKKAIELDMPDEPRISDKVLEQISQFKMINFDDLQTLNDFKLLKISWIFDLNFPISHALVLENDSLTKIYNSLSVKTKETANIFNMAIGYCEANASM